jgi:hypothetical protein
MLQLDHSGLIIQYFRVLPLEGVHLTSRGVFCRACLHRFRRESIASHEREISRPQMLQIIVDWRRVLQIEQISSSSVAARPVVAPLLNVLGSLHECALCWSN